MHLPFKCLLISALGISIVNGHGWLSKPAATFDNAAGDKSQFVGTIDSSSTGFKGTFNTAPADNVASFTKAFKSSTYKSLKALIDGKAKITVSGATLTCGIAEPDASPQPLPATLEWYHSDSEEFTASHEGPCEAWCDDTMVFNDENCAANFKMAPAEMPYEKSKCLGAKMLTFYWLAMHGPSWQVYVNCAPLSSGGATAQDSGSTSTTTKDSGSTSTTTQDSNNPSTKTTASSSADTPTVTTATQAASSANSPSMNTSRSTTTAGSSTHTPTVTSAPSTGGSPSTTTTSTQAEESDCGSLDVAGGSEGGSQDTGAQTHQQVSTNTGAQSQGNTYQQESTNMGTQSQANIYQQGSTNTGTQSQVSTYQQGSTSTGTQLDTGNVNQWGNPSQWSNGGNVTWTSVCQ
ncbi:unnamed protein product [Phytophthora fragariaefolia]|uniref:Unnamed protein product n=1 Tax=Phytophthora fragariaefolia TaxID=1490495 RepID=A0A9W7D3T1_9STRA|nr:unnamed protein product [Phytophthora fragariaefolia]